MFQLRNLGEWLRSKRTYAARAHKTLVESDRTMNAMSMDEVRDLILNQLADPNVFDVELANPNSVLPDGFPPTMAFLFSLYRSVNFLGLAYISLDQFHPLEGMPDWYMIGLIADDVVAFKLGSDQITIICASGETEDYTSIFHWLLTVANAPDLD